MNLQSLVHRHLCNGVQGNCSADIPASMLSAEDVAARKPGQCAIVIDHTLLTVIYGRLWMDSLFIALRHSSRTPGVSIIGCGDSDKTAFDNSPAGGSLWLTRSVVQGQAAPGPEVLTCTAVAVYSKFAAYGVVPSCCTCCLLVSDLTQHRHALSFAWCRPLQHTSVHLILFYLTLYPVPLSRKLASAAARGICGIVTSQGCHADVEVRQAGGDYIPVYVFGTASLEASALVDNVIGDGGGAVSYTINTGSVTWLKNVTFANNTGPTIMNKVEGRVFSSQPGLQSITDDSTIPQPVPVQQEWTPQFLSFSDPWLLAAAKVCTCPTRCCGSCRAPSLRNTTASENSLIAMLGTAWGTALCDTALLCDDTAPQVQLVPERHATIPPSAGGWLRHR